MMVPSNNFNNNMVFNNNNMRFNQNNNNFQFNNNIQFNNNFNFPMMNQQMINMNINNMMMNNMHQNFPNMNNNMNNNMLIEPNKDIKLNKLLNIASVIPINKCSDKYSDKEFDEIIQVCMVAIKDKVEDLPKFCVEKIKEKLKGQWFVLVSDINDKNFEFGFSLQINDKDIIIFRCGNKIFYVSSIK